MYRELIDGLFTKEDVVLSNRKYDSPDRISTLNFMHLLKEVYVAEIKYGFSKHLGRLIGRRIELSRKTKVGLLD